MAWTYEAPLRDMRFVIESVLAAPHSWRTTEGFSDLDMATVEAILDSAAQFCREVLLPLNSVGDAQGCRLDDSGRVRTPDGFREAYQAFVKAGWPGLSCAPQWGGQGLPMLIDAAIREMLSACNHAWTMYPDLLHGAYESLLGHADETLKQRYLPRIASGEWLAAMALTEPQAGSDLGLIRTLAQPQPDGSFEVSGNKIFISGGDHDLTDNIVHLVLCRLPGSAPGTRGLSLVLVPTVLPDTSRNSVYCDGIEHKMGIHGSATCAIRYERARGWLVGEAGRGLNAMFLMMNSARLHVGLQGLGHQEMASQNAVRYARERVQGSVSRSAPLATSPIVEHPAMRHALLRLQAMTQAQRVIAYRAALAIDDSHHHPDASKRAASAALAGLLTPVVKAFLTHQGFQAASAALQVFGGYGYVREYGIEQTLRDSRIAMIYEGTNEIQAIDLLQRKILGDGGATLAAWHAQAGEDARACETAGLVDFAAALRHAIADTRNALEAIMAAQPEDPPCVLRVADDFLFGFSHALLAWAFAVSALAAQQQPDDEFARVKLDKMRYGLNWILPQASVHWERVVDGVQGLTLPAA